MKLSTIIASVALLVPAVSAAFCNRNSPLVCCESLKSTGCLCPDTPANCCDEDCDINPGIDKRGIDMVDIEYVHPEMRSLHKKWLEYKRSLAPVGRVAQPLVG